MSFYGKSVMTHILSGSGLGSGEGPTTNDRDEMRNNNLEIGGPGGSPMQEEGFHLCCLCHPFIQFGIHLQPLGRQFQQQTDCLISEDLHDCLVGKLLQLPLLD